MDTTNDMVIASATDIGKRERQEDWSLVSKIDDGTLLIVADGLGGYPDGDWASKTFSEIFAENFGVFLKSCNDIKEALHKCLHYSNRMFCREITLEGKSEEASTTLVAMFIREKIATYISMGDSIVLVFDMLNGQRLHENYKQESINGWITSCSGILFAGGVSEVFPVLPEMLIILATDGIETILDNKFIFAFLKDKNKHDLAKELVEETISRQTHDQDNITVITAIT